MNPPLSRLYVPWIYQAIKISPLDYLRQMPVCTTNHRRLLMTAKRDVLSERHPAALTRPWTLLQSRRKEV